MKNKLSLILLGVLIFVVAGFFFSKSMVVLLATFIPGLITTIISQSFGYGGSESLIGSPEVLIATLLFWLLTPWLLYLKYKTRENNELLLGLIIFTASWPIGVSLRFLAMADYKSGYLWVIILLVVQLFALILMSYMDKSRKSRN